MLIFKLLLTVLAPFLAFGLAFIANGLLLARGARVATGMTEHAAADLNEIRDRRRIRILSFNIAKVFAYRRRLQFVPAALVRSRLDEIGRIIAAEKPDLVFLCEVLFECGPCPINHVTTIAQAAGMHAWAFGENYNFGLPWYRISGGNAILSRWPLVAVQNPSLGTRKPFYRRSNSRRALFCRLNLGGRTLLLASAHNDSRSVENNLAQIQGILSRCTDCDTILAGDFNALPGSPSIELIRKSERFLGAVAGPPTHPAHCPVDQRDYIFAPACWELVEHRVLPPLVSDHLAVVSTFSIPEAWFSEAALDTATQPGIAVSPRGDRPRELDAIRAWSYAFQVSAGVQPGRFIAFHEDGQ